MTPVFFSRYTQTRTRVQKPTQSMRYPNRPLLQLLVLVALPLMVLGASRLPCFRTDVNPTPPAPEGCASILCPYGTTCVPDPKQCITQPCPQVKCVKKDEGEEGGKGDDAPPCIRTGCSKEICSDTPSVSPCIFNPTFACFNLDTAVCQRDADGKCAWKYASDHDAKCQQSMSRSHHSRY